MGKYEIIQKYCAKSSIRESIMVPFIIDEYVYATDSFQMCRIKKDLFTPEEIEKIQADRLALGRFALSYPGNSPTFYAIEDNAANRAAKKEYTGKIQPVNAEELMEEEDEIINDGACQECED